MAEPTAQQLARQRLAATDLARFAPPPKPKKAEPDKPKVHPTQKPVPLLKKLIDLFTDEGDVVIDPCCGSGTTLLAAQTLDRKSYGFEVDRNFFNDSINKLLGNYQPDMFQALKYESKAV